MSALWVLHLRRPLQQPLRTAVAVIAIAGGVALSLGVAVAHASVQRSFQDITSFVAGPATLRVRGPVEQAGLDQAAVARLAAVDGVRTVVPLVTTVVQVGDPRDPGSERMILAFGADCTIEAVLGDVGCTDELIDFASASDLPLVSERLASGAGARRCDLHGCRDDADRAGVEHRGAR